MNSDSGGMTNEERQRQTAAEIARKKVMAAYQSSPTYASSEPENDIKSDDNSSYKSTPVNQTVDADAWKKYHSAWQDYYQKYYSDYYSKAAQSFVEQERQKFEHELEESKQLGAAPETVEATLKERVQKKADSRFHLKKKHKKFIPIIAGVFAVLFVLFLQYNRLIFAPIIAYVSPGNVSDNGIAAVDPTVQTAVNEQNTLYIPKINVQVPVAFNIALDQVDNAMVDGVAHYRINGASAFPGEYGRVVITGHSAGDVYIANSYKYIFSGLERLTEGDLIYIDYNHVRYTYKMTGSEVIEPTDVARLVYNGNGKVLTLITCTPLGTSRYRLLVHAEQISPTFDAGTDMKTVTEDEVEDVALPSNEATFFERVGKFFTSVWNWLTGRG